MISFLSALRSAPGPTCVLSVAGAPHEGKSTLANAILRTAGMTQVIVRTFEDVSHKMTPPTLSLLVDFVHPSYGLFASCSFYE